MNTSNDTVYFEQAFDNYYAYDDGTPEQGFAVAGGGAMVAYQFRLLEPDTLTGVAINFLEMFEDVENSFKIKVWSHADTIPGNSIYESDYYSVPKLIVDKDLRTPLSFVSKEIDTLLILPAGIYYIGWKQERDHKFFVGYDMNNNASDKLFYSTGNGWEKFSEPGAVLMRPEFGKSTYKPIISASIQKLDRKFTLYPNPVRDYLSIEFTGSDICNIAIYDMFGKLTMQTSIASKEQISIASLANGMYTCRIFNGDYESIQKLIVNR